MHTMKTPALIMFGTQDTNVPTGQGWEHFRAMQQGGVAPVRFILHRKRKISEELEQDPG